MNERERLMALVSELPPHPNWEQLTAVINAAFDYRNAIESVRTREWQARELDEDPDKVVRWLGDIGTFASDMVYHAKRMGRAVRGDFNNIALIARPDSTEKDVLEQWSRVQRQREAQRT